MLIQEPGPFAVVADAERRATLTFYKWWQNISRAALQVGDFRASSVNVAKPGEVKPDGSAILRSAHADLFRLIGTTYGAGDGSTTFNLPTLADAPPVYHFIRVRP